MSPESAVRRNPDETREELLAAAFEAFHRVGFQSTSLDDILARTGLTKGALYHHFPNKHALGWAVVEELIEPMVLEGWVTPLQASTDPVTALTAILLETGEKISEEEIKIGCPLNNLAQEMSPVEEGFRTRIDKIYASWRNGIADALRAGQDAGTVRGDIDAAQTAMFIVASLEGCIGLAKNAQSLVVLRQCGAGLIQYLEGLR